MGVVNVVASALRMGVCVPVLYVVIVVDCKDCMHSNKGVEVIKQGRAHVNCCNLKQLVLQSKLTYHGKNCSVKCQTQ